jgi:hypothetical protein
MLQQIEQRITNLYNKTLLETNFKSGIYSIEASNNLCRKISDLSLTLNAYVLVGGIRPSTDTIYKIKKIKGFVCI